MPLENPFLELKGKGENYKSGALIHCRSRSSVNNLIFHFMIRERRINLKTGNRIQSEQLNTFSNSGIISEVTIFGDLCLLVQNFAFGYDYFIFDNSISNVSALQ